MEKFTITITREFGSLGRTIARELSRELGIEFYDRDIVEEVSRQLNMPVSTISDTEEKSKSRFLPRMFPLGTDEEYIQKMIFEVQKEIIFEMAGRSSCIIVGRCSDAILENEKNNLNIYIYAPVAKRLENCVKRLDMTPTEAKKMIMSVDKARKAYHKKYAGFSPDDPKHKAILMDSSLLGPERTAVVLAEIIRQKFEIEKRS